MQRLCARLTCQQTTLSWLEHVSSKGGAISALSSRLVAPVSRWGTFDAGVRQHRAVGFLLCERLSDGLSTARSAAVA